MQTDPDDEAAARFADIHPPLTAQQALVEAERCYFCHDAPCVEACPTDIDVPGFIRGIATGNLTGAATTILNANILGGACARVCPTEILCERACVRTAECGEPVRIGALQRHATDWLMDRGETPFIRAPSTGRRIAVVGSGPAGLACAHGLARRGHDVTVFEAREKPGGLNEYGIAAYKMTGDFAQREVDFILSIGGIAIECGRALGRDLNLAALLDGHDAVFLAIGQAGVRALGLDGARLAGVRHAVEMIAELRQGAAARIGRNVVVIGGGNTAVDAAVQSRLLGAEDVTIVYRREAARMSATPKERAWAKTNDVRIRDCLAPVELLGEDGAVRGVVLARTHPETGAALGAETVTLEADMVLSAIGQLMLAGPLTESGIALAIENGRIAVDQAGRTSVPRLYAGGDCTAGADLTVSAVQDGKLAAEAIHRDLAGAG